MANNIGISIDLCAFKSVIEKKKNQAGQQVDCIVIPIEANNLKLSTDNNGKPHVNVYGFGNPRTQPSKFENDKSTHILNHDPGKEIREALKSENPPRYPATLGSLTVWDQVQQGGIEPQNQSVGFVQEGDALPF